MEILTNEKLLARIKELEEKVELYENGDQNLYRSLQRKQNEIAKFLNANSLDKIDLTDKGKEFERIFLVLQKCEAIASSAKTFGEIAGVISTKEASKPFVDTIAVAKNG